jgi:hypothetical protein
MKINRYRVASFLFFQMSAWFFVIAAIIFLSNIEVVAFCLAYVVTKTMWRAFTDADEKASALDQLTKSPDKGNSSPRSMP